MVIAKIFVPTSFISRERTFLAIEQYIDQLCKDIRSTLLQNLISSLSVIAFERGLLNILNKEDILNKFSNTKRKLEL